MGAWAGIASGAAEGPLWVASRPSLDAARKASMRRIPDFRALTPELESSTLNCRSPFG